MKGTRGRDALHDVVLRRSGDFTHSVEAQLDAPIGRRCRKRDLGDAQRVSSERERQDTDDVGALHVVDGRMGDDVGVAADEAALAK